MQAAHPLLGETRGMLPQRQQNRPPGRGPKEAGNSRGCWTLRGTRGSTSTPPAPGAGGLQGSPVPSLSRSLFLGVSVLVLEAAGAVVRALAAVHIAMGPAGFEGSPSAR